LKDEEKAAGLTGTVLAYDGIAIIVKHAVQYHRGRLNMESEINKGTTVSVIFDAKSLGL